MPEDLVVPRRLFVVASDTVAVEVAGHGGAVDAELDGKLADGMLPKAAAIEAAIANGVQRVHVISWKLADSILLEDFSNEGTGTLVGDDISALSAAEQAAQS